MVGPGATGRCCTASTVPCPGSGPEDPLLVLIAHLSERDSRTKVSVTVLEPRGAVKSVVRSLRSEIEIYASNYTKYTVYIDKLWQVYLTI